MFSFGKRKQHAEIAGYLRRICDSTTPNNGMTDHSDRKESRYNRTIPVLIWPWVDDHPVAETCVTAATKDVTDHGVGLILTAPLTSAEIVVGILSDETASARPWFFRGEIVRGKSIGAGYWLYGARLLELLNRDRPEVIESLVDQTAQLQPIPRAEFSCSSK